MCLYFGLYAIYIYLFILFEKKNCNRANGNSKCTVIFHFLHNTITIIINKMWKTEKKHIFSYLFISFAWLYADVAVCVYVSICFRFVVCYLLLLLLLLVCIFANVFPNCHRTNSLCALAHQRSMCYLWMMAILSSFFYFFCLCLTHFTWLSLSISLSIRFFFVFDFNNEKLSATTVMRIMNQRDLIMVDWNVDRNK